MAYKYGLSILIAVMKEQEAILVVKSPLQLKDT